MTEPRTVNVSVRKPSEAEILTSEPTFRPLYQQVRERLQQRMIEGTWTPGMLLPSEGQLAANLRVSQGTVRKALDAMAADNLLVRQQGRGTFVAVPEEGNLRFQFFRMESDEGERLTPHSEVVGFRKSRADAFARQTLALKAPSFVWEIDRVRRVAREPRIAERITVPVVRFPDLDRIGDMPNNVYALYSKRYGVTIHRVSEKLKADSLGAADAKLLGYPQDTPILRIVRTAFSLDGAAVEVRVSRCVMEGMAYSSELK